MHIGIVGSREFPSRKVFREVLDREVKSDDIIVTGYNCTCERPKGPDEWAYEYARLRDMPEPLLFPAQWKKYGRGAGFMRNTDIVNHSNRVIAFWDRKSKGTIDTVKKAIKAKKPVLVIDPKGVDVTKLVLNEVSL
jgi:hypothetical protein